MWLGAGFWGSHLTFPPLHWGVWQGSRKVSAELWGPVSAPPHLNWEGKWMEVGIWGGGVPSLPAWIGGHIVGIGSGDLGALDVVSH